MPSSTTPNYQLNQWAADDLVQRTDFNADNAKIDAALKAAADARSTLSTQVAAKAEQSALTAEVNARTSADAAINAVLPKKGNCTLYHASYTGDGQKTRTLTFPGKPRFIFIMEDGFYMHMINGIPTCIATDGGIQITNCSVVWSGNSVSWTYVNNTYNRQLHCNNNGISYQLIALIDASE